MQKNVSKKIAPSPSPYTAPVRAIASGGRLQQEKGQLEREKYGGDESYSGRDSGERERGY